MMRALPAVAAYAAGVQVVTLRQWVRRGHISPTDDHGCYDLAEILSWIERRDQHRARIAESRYGSCASRRYGTPTDASVTREAY